MVMCDNINTYPATTVGISDISVRENVSSVSELASNGYTQHRNQTNQQLLWTVHSLCNLLFVKHCLYPSSSTHPLTLTAVTVPD